MAINDVTASNLLYPDAIAGAIHSAASATGVDFSFLFQQAKVESGLNAQAKAGTSSATGLFQFTRDTWLKVVEQHGDSMGLSSEAASLRGGAASASDRQRILDMRSNPEVSARMAAHYAIDNARALQAQGHTVSGPTDLYLAHFLGSGGASKFLAGMKENPNAPAASILPSAAGANKAIFYKNGVPASFNDIYQRFAKRFDTSAPVSTNATQIAARALAETATPERVTTVNALVSRLKVTDTLSAKHAKLGDQLAASGGIASQKEAIVAARAQTTAAPQAMRTKFLHNAQPAPTPLAPLQAQAAPVDTQTTPIRVDSLAKFLDSASKWSADPEKMHDEIKKGVVTRDAFQGAETRSL